MFAILEASALSFLTPQPDMPVHLTECTLSKNFRMTENVSHFRHTKFFVRACCAEQTTARGTGNSTSLTLFSAFESWNWTSENHMFLKNSAKQKRSEHELCAQLPDEKDEAEFSCTHHRSQIVIITFQHLR